MLLHGLDEPLLADDDPGLGAAQQLVPTEGDDIDAGADEVLDGRLGAGEAAGEVDQVAAAHVGEHRYAGRGSKGHHFGGAHLGREAEDGEVAAVHLEKERGLIRDGVAVILGVGPVGGADLPQGDTG